MLARVVFGILYCPFELQPYGPNSYVTHFRASHLLVPELCRACNKRDAPGCFCRGNLWFRVSAFCASNSPWVDWGVPRNPLDIYCECEKHWEGLPVADICKMSGCTFGC